VFALGRLPEGGCILADEVGLGKTIEAGLVIAQRLSEGARRILLLTPKPLLGQWRQELYDLFGIESVEAWPVPGGFDGEGVLLAGREAATGDAGLAALVAAAPVDLVVVDEAHEVFGGLYKRFDRDGFYKEDSKAARRAGSFRRYVQTTDAPVMLLTATPIQNTLTELWSLVQYVDRHGVLLGGLSTFRELFCAGSDRLLIAGQEDELQDRLNTVVQRTLRRQAQEFLSRPFVERQARTFEYAMTTAERALYDEVTDYLLRPGIAAFRGNQRRLLLLGFHRRMASSTRALAASLDKVAARLGRLLATDDAGAHPGPSMGLDADTASFLDDLEEDPEDAQGELGQDDDSASDPEQVRAELTLVESFATRARALPSDAKLGALLQAVRLVLERGRTGEGSGKVVVFTESLVTQDYLAEKLVENGLVGPDDITVFRGQNEGPRAHAALERWRSDPEQRAKNATAPARDIAVRLALVHEFRTRTRVLLSTEAGAKGLNLQFCETIVNYDLPWNPQRIEQRIGRCHRYGQTRAVTVVNFLSKDNEAERLTYDILSQKLDLFGRVLDASDQVLHEPGKDPSEALVGAMGPELEGELRRIHERARSQDEIVSEIRALRDRIDARRETFEETHRRTAGLIESRFDDEVRRVFRHRRDEVDVELGAFDRDLARVVLAYLDARGLRYEQRDEGASRILDVRADARLPEALRAGATVAIGPAETVQSLHLGHPLVQAAAADARTSTADTRTVEVDLGDAPPAVLEPYRGSRGRFTLVLARHDGFEVVDSLLPVVLLEGQPDALPDEAVHALLDAPMRDGQGSEGPRAVDDVTLDDAVEAALYRDRRAVDEAESPRYARQLSQIERHVEDRVLVLERRRRALDERLERQMQRRDAVLGAEARAEIETLLRKAQVELDGVESRLAKLELRDDEDYVAFKRRSQTRRYVPPTPTRLFDVDLVIR